MKKMGLQEFLIKNPALMLEQAIGYMSHVNRKSVFPFPTRSDTNPAVPPQKVARGLKL